MKFNLASLHFNIKLFLSFATLYFASYNFDLRILFVWAILLSFLFIKDFFLIFKKMNYSTLVLCVFLFIYSFFSIVPSIIDNDYKGGIENGLYLLFLLIPLFFTAVLIGKQTKSNLYTAITSSFLVLSIIICFVFFQGIIDSNRYQQVGNVLSVLAILFLFNKHLVVKLLFIPLVLIILSTGSRQAIFGLLFVGIFYFIRSYKRASLFIIPFIVYFLTKLNFIEFFRVFEFLNFRTVGRIIYKLENVENSRFDIWQAFIERISFSPNFVDFGLSRYFMDLPHNFFIEYSYVTGLFFGIPFTLFIVYSLFKLKCESYLLAIALFYFFTFNISSGLTAAKYFFFLLFIALQRPKTDSA